MDETREPKDFEMMIDNAVEIAKEEIDDLSDIRKPDTVAFRKRLDYLLDKINEKLDA